MKKIITLIILIAATLGLAAQNYSTCYTSSMDAGEAAWRQGKYEEARIYFLRAKECHGGNPTAAQKRVNDCTAKIHQQYSGGTNVSTSSSFSAVSKTFSVGGVSFTVKPVEGGSFTMGCTREQGDDCDSDESPTHNVTVGSFWMGETEVTQGLWEVVMGSSVSDQRDKANTSWSLSGEGYTYPIYYVSWDEAVQFCNKLNTRLSGKLPSGWHFALPTEAEWEYAARGGNKRSGYKYSGSNTLDEVAWYSDNSGNRIHPVKGKRANALGLYDMSGNVYEWCSDWYMSDYYTSSPSNNPTGPTSGSYRVIRGGRWNGDASYCRVSYRLRSSTDTRSSNYGFRIALVRR